MGASISEITLTPGSGNLTSRVVERAQAASRRPAGRHSLITATWQKLGPGLLMAGAAIGVSHLVQATRAGADYGYQLLVLVLLVNLFKYPFFEYGHRYAVANRENLVNGYLRMGRPFLHAFLVLNLLSAVGGVAGVTFVTAGLAQHLFGSFLETTGWSMVLMGVCLAILMIGRYRWLDLSMKGIVAVLFVSTAAAFVAALVHGPVAPPDFVGLSAWTTTSLAFLIALMGWMPAPIEVSVWQSLWIEAKERTTGKQTSLGAAKVDFNTGYGLTTVLAVLFLGLGALVMHGSGVALQKSSSGFAAQLVDLYTQTLGTWAAPLIAVAALTTMFSTMLTVLDAYPRSLAVGIQLVLPKLRLDLHALHGIWIVGACLVSLIVINSFVNRLTELIDLAATIAFLAAPVYAYLNYRLIVSTHTPEDRRPGVGLRALSWAGLLFLSGFGLVFLVYRFAPGW